MKLPGTMSVQYHPEAAPGPRDTEYLFSQFVRNHKKRKGEGKVILIIDFGSQYNQLIARRVREHHVYCQIEPPDISHCSD